MDPWGTLDVATEVLDLQTLRSGNLIRLVE